MDLYFKDLDPPGKMWWIWSPEKKTYYSVFVVVVVVVQQTVYLETVGTAVAVETVEIVVVLGEQIAAAGTVETAVVEQIVVVETAGIAVDLGKKIREKLYQV